jgi:enoyl-CoA hydratase/carnithine racemase
MSDIEGDDGLGGLSHYAGGTDVGYERDGDLVRITLRRPEKLNAIREETTLELRRAFHAFELDPLAKVAVLSGEGRAFCAGADTSKHNLPQLQREAGKLRDRRADLLHESIHWKPVIAAVHGYTLGFGLMISIRCDLLVADETAIFQVTEIPIGLSANSIWALIATRTGTTFADDVTLTGRRFGAAEARDRSMITTMTPAGGHVAEAERLAGILASHPGGGMRDAVRYRRAQVQKTMMDATLMRPFTP